MAEKWNITLKIYRQKQGSGALAQLPCGERPGC